MRTLSALGKDKRAVSIIVSYVLLITITLSLSVLVYNWLRWRVQPVEIPECSSNVKIVIQDYYCVPSDVRPGETTVSGNIQIILKNKGLHNVSGFNIRVHDREDAEFGFYTLEEGGVQMAPDTEFPVGGGYMVYNFSDVRDHPTQLEKVTLIEVQPFIIEDDKIICKSYATQPVDC
jgi:hypothetical protein